MLIIKRLRLVLSLMFGVLLLLSCQKDELSKEMDFVGQSFSGLAAFNAVEQSASLQFIVDDKVMNAGDEAFELGGYIRHKGVFDGRRNIQLHNKALNKEVFRGAHEFVKNKVYSLFFYGKEQVQVKVVEDDMIAPASGKAKIRFANFSNSGKLQLKTIKGTSSMPANFNLSAQQVTDFAEYDVATVEFQFNTELSKLLLNFVPENKGVYTLFVVPVEQKREEEYLGAEYKVMVIKHS